MINSNNCTFIHFPCVKIGEYIRWWKNAQKNTSVPYCVRTNYNRHENKWVGRCEAAAGLTVWCIFANLLRKVDLIDFLLRNRGKLMPNFMCGRHGEHLKKIVPVFTAKICVISLTSAFGSFMVTLFNINAMAPGGPRGYQGTITVAITPFNMLVQDGPRWIKMNQGVQ